MKEKLKLEERNAVESFQLLAREYCSVVAPLEEGKPDEFLTKIASILGKLYGEALLLPDIFPSINRNRLSKRKLAQHTKRYKHLNDLLAAKLGAANSYWKVFDPPDKKSLVSKTLSDDLADISLVRP
jgi:hypothetical protein